MRILCVYCEQRNIIMAKVNTNISLDPALKAEAVALFKNIGLDLSTAISLFLSQAVREKKIPFEIKLDIPNETTIEALDEKEEMKKNKQKYKRYDDFKDALKEI